MILNNIPSAGVQVGWPIMFNCEFLCGTLCGKNFQNLLKYASKDKIGKIEIKHFQEVTSCHEVRKLGGLAYESVGRVFESPWARQ
jgi:hypothetical protein